MFSFTVWAPRLKAVAVETGGVKYPMERKPHGWWQADVEAANHGDDYLFYVDEDHKGYPDPRSLWQPHGVHGASRVLDQREYAWKDTGWGSEEGHMAAPLSQAVIYELHIGTFTPEGTFTSAIEKLPALKELGITHVEIMPVNSFPGRWGWSYDGVQLYAPQQSYGGPEGLKQLIDAIHGHGMAALLDVVYNHFGPSGNYTGKFGNYITESHLTPWGGAVNLEEGGSTEVRRFFIDNAMMWMRDYHFDGLRLDAVQSFVDRSATHFLEQLALEINGLKKELGRSLVLIAESDLNDPRLVTSRGEKGGYGLDAHWSDDFHHAVFAYLTGERRSYYSDFGKLGQIAKSLNSVYIYDGVYSEFRQRVHGREVHDLSAHCFVSCIQNHDQIGNRAYGDRIREAAGFRKAKLGAAMLFTAPFVPLIFQGEEFAASSPFLYFSDHDDPELRRSVSEGRRAEHAGDEEWGEIPDPESDTTFTDCKLKWDEVTEGEHAEMLAWYRDLIALRQTRASLRDGRLDRLKVSFDEEAGWLVMERDAVRLLFNFSDADVEMPVAEGSEILLASDKGIEVSSPTLKMPPTSFMAVLTLGATPERTSAPEYESVDQNAKS